MVLTRHLQCLGAIPPMKEVKAKMEQAKADIAEAETQPGIKEEPNLEVFSAVP